MGEFHSAAVEQLSLYVRHLAWLHATPTPKKGTLDKDRKSRIEQFRADEDAGTPHTELDLPVLDVGEHLIGYLFDVGPANDGAAISFQEIGAWCGLTGHVLTSWEASTLRSLSKAYLGEYSAASDPQRPAPYAAPRALTRTQVASKLLSAFDRLERQDRRKG